MSYSFQKNNSNAAVTVGELNQVVNGLELPYKSYVATLTQSNLDDPSATVIYNSLNEDIVWLRSGTGQYNGTLTGAFTVGKTVVILGTNTLVAGSSAKYDSQNADIDTVPILTYDDSFTIADGMLINTVIEIRVYN
jgi:hypothetical protein